MRKKEKRRSMDGQLVSEICAEQCGGLLPNTTFSIDVAGTTTTEGPPPHNKACSLQSSFSGFRYVWVAAVWVDLHLGSIVLLLERG